MKWANYRYYARYYRLVAAAVMLLMAVLSGSLLLGDSVRGTLRDRVAERLDGAETVITSGTDFLSDAVMQLPLLADARGYLLAQGFVSDEGRLLPVYVWGTDYDSLSLGQCLVNDPLRKRLRQHSDIVLHLPSHSLVPSGSLFVTKSYATQLRLHVEGTKDVEHGGNLLLMNEQALPLNVFLSREELAEAMELQGKLNVILSQRRISDSDLLQGWNPQWSGIHVSDTSLVADRIFLPSSLIDSIQSVQRYFSYLVNDLCVSHAPAGDTQQTDTVPYSFVTAVEAWQGERLEGHAMILSDYAAQRLRVGVGDSVDMSYFVAHDLKNLDTASQRFCVKRVVPLTDFMQDSLLVTSFPGLSHVEKCTDWDSDLPIRMDHVHKVDEDYWYTYQQLPKALVAYDAVIDHWGNSFGTATALRFTENQLSVDSASLHFTLASFRASDALALAGSGTDFSSLFLALGFFLIVSAILLMRSPLQEMLSARASEVRLYAQLGYPRKRIYRIFYREIMTVILLASPFGILVGVAYSGLTLWLLGNVWSGATHTEGFALHVQPLTLLAGWLAGLLVCVLTLLWLLRRTLNSRPASAVQPPRLPMQHAAIILLVITSLLVTCNFISLHSMALFVLCGLLWIITLGLFLETYIRARAIPTRSLTRQRLVWQSLYASLRHQRVAYWTLSLGVFTVFAVGLNRPDFGDRDSWQTATGGYSYYVETTVPIQYDLNNPAARTRLSLTDLPEGTVFLQFLRHTADEASCLNLNRVATPTIIAPLPPPEEGALVCSQAAKTVSANSSFYSILSPFGLAAPSSGDGEEDLFLDQESLVWSLMRSVGDTLYYTDSRGREVPLVIAGSYPTGIFHGSALMPAETFRRLWPDESGVEVLLVKSSRPDEAVELLSVALSEYGMHVQTTDERVRLFFEVTDTYLLIFFTLGALGLLLGICSMLIIVRKNLTAQRPSICLLRALGFPERVVRVQLLRENVAVPLYAVAVGAVGSVISISANVAGAGLSTLLLALFCLALLLLGVWGGVRYIVNRYIDF